MNQVFVIGTVKEKIEFKFIYKGQYISKASTKIELRDKSIVEIIGYDNIADFMYKYLYLDTTIIIEGKLFNGKIKIDKIAKT